MRGLTAALVACACIIGTAAMADDSSPADLGSKILPSLVKVISVCGQANESRVATGFVWGPDRQVVTDMHVVVGCQPPFSVLYFVRNGTTITQTVRDAVVSKVLRSADLVLLTVTNPPDAPPLKLADQPASPEQWVEAWGFPLGIEAPIDTRLQVTFANDLFPQLSSTLDDTARSQIQALHFPDLSSQVLHLSGPLQPGDSGAPVVDAAGRLVGIGSGGLQQGAASISWAMRGFYLDQLLASTDSLPSGGTAGSLFAYAVRSAPAADVAHATPPPTILCGQLGLTSLGTRRLSQLAVTADSRNAVQQVAQDEQVSPADLAAAPYQVWVEPRSGAAVVLPAGLDLQSGKAVCQADSHQADARLLIRLDRLPADPDTPEWALAVSHTRWQAVGLFGHPEGSARRPAWHPLDRSRQVVANGALVHRAVLADRDGERLYRADFDGRQVSLAEGVLERAPAGQLPPAARLDLARLLLALDLSSFPPPDQTQATDIETPPSDEEAGDETAPTTGPKFYTVLHCGRSMLLMSDVPRLGTLAAADPDAKMVAAAVQAGTKVSIDSVSNVQYDAWAQVPSGSIALVPRGMGHELRPEEKGACLFASPDAPGLHVALIGRAAVSLTNTADLVRDALKRMLHLSLGAEQPSTAAQSGTIQVMRLQAVATDSDSRAYHVIAVSQLQDGFMLVSVVTARDDLGAHGPAPRVGAALAGLLLAPGVSASRALR
jgi:S1-C subfamily serine protease